MPNTENLAPPEKDSDFAVASVVDTVAEGLSLDPVRVLQSNVGPGGSRSQHAEFRQRHALARRLCVHVLREQDLTYGEMAETLGYTKDNIGQAATLGRKAIAGNPELGAIVEQATRRIADLNRVVPEGPELPHHQMAARTVDVVCGLMGTPPTRLYKRFRGAGTGSQAERFKRRMALKISAALLREQGLESELIAESLNYRPSSIGVITSGGVWQVEHNPAAKAVAGEARRRLGLEPAQG